MDDGITRQVSPAILSDADAWRELVAHYPRLRGVVAKVLDERDRVEAVLHDGLVAAVAGRHRFDPARGVPFAGWAAVVVRRTALKQRGRSRLHREVFAHTEVEGVAPAHRPCSLATATRVLRALSEEDVAVLEMRFDEGLTWEECAARVGCTVNVMRGRVGKALERARAVAERSAWGGAD